MNDDFSHSPSIEIPDFWTAQQALEISDFLGNVLAAIWRIYGSDMARHVQQHGPFPPESIPHGRDDDDLPF